MSRPAVEHMCGHMQEGALGAAVALLRIYDARTDVAIGKYVAILAQAQAQVTAQGASAKFNPPVQSSIPQ